MFKNQQQRWVIIVGWLEKNFDKEKKKKSSISVAQSDGDISSLVDPVGHFRIIIIINFL